MMKTFSQRNGPRLTGSLMTKAAGLLLLAVGLLLAPAGLLLAVHRAEVMNLSQTLLGETHPPTPMEP